MASTLPTIEPEVTQYTPIVFDNECEQYRGIVSKYDWNVDLILAIMMSESGCGQFAINEQDNHGICIGSYGLMQLACLHFSEGQDKFDIETNISVAYRVYKDSGLNAWTGYSSGAYLQYL